MLNSSVGIENMAINLTPDLNRKGAEKLRLDLCPW